jgi:hypothetical protein
MPACSNPPNRPSRDVLDRLIEAVAWAKTCMMIAAASAPGSPGRLQEMAKLREAVIGPRKVVDEILGKAQALPREVLIALRTCELAIPKLEAGAVLRREATAHE